MDLLRCGDHGPVIAEVRSILIAQNFLSAEPTNTPPADLSANGWSTPEAVFDEELLAAVQAFQQERRLLVDGIIGSATYRTLLESSYTLGARVLYYQLSAPMHGDDVSTLQQRLQNLGYYTGLADGYFGKVTHDSLSAYQREYGLSDDGICGPETIRSLGRLGRRVTGGSPHAIREEEHVRASGPKLTGKKIVLDAAGDSPEERELLWALANLLEGRMTAAGMQTFRSATQFDAPNDTDRAKIANRFNADLTIALRFGHHHTSAANGVASFYFGTAQGSASAIGKSLAGFIQREILARTDFQDCRTHDRTWDMLRLTKMPAVLIDLGFITNPGDAEKVRDTLVLNAIADAILVAVKRMYLLGKNDQPTGTYTFAELLAAEAI